MRDPAGSEGRVSSRWHGEGEGGRGTGKGLATLFPEIGLLEGGQVWRGRSSCVGGAFELSQWRCQTRYTLL